MWMISSIYGAESVTFIRIECILYVFFTTTCCMSENDETENISIKCDTFHYTKNPFSEELPHSVYSWKFLFLTMSKKLIELDLKTYLISPICYLIQCDIKKYTVK